MTPPPSLQLIEMATGLYQSRVLFAAAKFGIADLLAPGPQSAEALAESAGIPPRILHRFLRSLAGFGILTTSDDVSFALTPLGEALKSGAPGAARSTILSLAGDGIWRALEHFPYSLETGRTGVEKAFGMEFFDYLAHHPEQASLFSEAMVGIHGLEPPAVAAAYDFSVFDSVADIGGATGNMLIHILSRHPGPRGILYDRPHVTADAPAFIEKHGLTSRISIESGNFFDHVPPGAGAYILSHIIHDWAEVDCLTILGNCRNAMAPASKLLIVEFVLPPGDTPHFGKLADMIMLAIPGGEERTAAEYQSLLAKAGFRLDRVVPTESPVSIVEASLL